MAAGVFNGARDQAERDEFPVCPADHYAVVGLVDGLHGVTVHAFAPLPMSDARTVELVDELRPLMDEMLWERGL
jgi:hypothetical protein